MSCLFYVYNVKYIRMFFQNSPRKRKPGRLVLLTMYKVQMLEAAARMFVLFLSIMGLIIDCTRKAEHETGQET